ncbi:MAG TPA: amidohydrolase family protein [Vicinamibacterales bacterium]|nr:amidohydrolase family protein [Vicinamibacterales bacterium]
MRPALRLLLGTVLTLAPCAYTASAQEPRSASPRASAVPPELLSYAELILVNGKILTVDADFTVAEAVAVRNGRILLVGASDAVRQFAGPGTRVIDLQGRSVVPGFIDSDADNAFAGGDLYKDTMVNGRIRPAVRADSVPAMLEEVRRLVEEAEPGSPVYVRMADEFLNDLSKLTAAELDAIAPANPLMLALTTDSVVNTRMLERAFAAGLPKDHIGVVTDATGKPTGQLFSAASGIVGWNLRDWPVITAEIFDEQEQINDDFLRVGVTTVTGHASGYTVTILNQLFHQGRLRIRVRPDLDFARQNPLADQFIRRTPNLVNFSLGDGMVRIAGAAIGPVDGASDDGSVLTNEPKLRVHPVLGGTPYGRNKWTGTTFTGRHWADLTERERQQTEAGTIFLLRRHGWNIGGNHNMGSQAATIVLETLSAAERQPDLKVKARLGRDALDHNLIWDERSIAAARALGDTIAFGLNSELWSPRIVRGEETLVAQYGDRLATMQPVKDLLEAGLNVHFEGGKPGEPPLWRVERFVTRVDRFQTRSERTRRRSSDSTPAVRTWGLDQRIDRRQALRMVTIAAARFISEEAVLGSIERGKYADLVVLNGDFLGVPDDEISTLEPVMTIVGGKVVFERNR